MKRKNEFRKGDLSITHTPKRNRCKCRLCGDIIESKSRHDFVKCKCGAIFTDGGTDYIRRGFGKPGTSWDDIIDLGDEDEPSQ